MSGYVQEALDIVGIAGLGSSESRREDAHTIRGAARYRPRDAKKNSRPTACPQEFHRTSTRFPQDAESARSDRPSQPQGMSFALYLRVKKMQARTTGFVGCAGGGDGAR